MDRGLRVVSVLEECRRRAGASAGEYRLSGVAQAWVGGQVIAMGWCAIEGQGWGAGQRRAAEQQGAIAAFFPECVMTGRWGVGRCMFVMRRHVHAHWHVHGRVMIHRHRLGNQRADKDHQHGEQA